jgi:hypothetical protein
VYVSNADFITAMPMKLFRLRSFSGYLEQNRQGGEYQSLSNPPSEPLRISFWQTIKKEQDVPALISLKFN